MDQEEQPIDMLSFELKEMENGLAVYEYSVEGRDNDCGLVEINIETGGTTVLDEAPGDFSKWYAFHLLRRLERDYSSNKLVDSGLEFWY